MQLEKKYYTVQDSETLKLMFQHIQESEVIAVDTETSGLNPRKDKIVGWSVSGEEGVGFYLPTLVWNFDNDKLELQTILDESTEVISKNLLKLSASNFCLMYASPNPTDPRKYRSHNMLSLCTVKRTVGPSWLP